MAFFKLSRHGSIPHQGTFGTLYFVDNKAATTHVALTCEREWLGNIPFISCVPPVTYALVRHHSSNLKLVLEGEAHGVFVAANPKATRSHINMEVANYPYELEGCIAVGKHHVTLNGRLGVSDSVATMEKIMDIFNEHQTFGRMPLTIQDF